MIVNDTFVATFGGPAATPEQLPGVVRMAVRNGYAIVPIAPGAKTPLCTLTARQAKAADAARREQLREVGRPWAGARHECGIAHALTDVAVADRVVKRLLKERGAINIGVEVGRSRMLMVDADTDEQVKAFAATWAAEEPGRDPSSARPTVATPGVMRLADDGAERWDHKDGGHFWFRLPEGVDLASLPGQGSMRDDSGWVAHWRDQQALVPPSVRPEGAYVLAGTVPEAPEWLLTRIQMAALGWAERRAAQAARVRHDGDPIDVWSAATGWAALLEPDGWVATGKPDRCGCPIWTRPGDATHYKSATAHELGCTHYMLDEGRGGPLHLWTDNPPSFLAEAVAVTGRRTFSMLQYVAWRDHAGSNSAAMSAMELAVLDEDGDVRVELAAALDALAAQRDPTIGERVVGPPAIAPAPAVPSAPALAETPPGPVPEPTPEPDPLAALPPDLRRRLAASRRLRFEFERQLIGDEARRLFLHFRQGADLAGAADDLKGALDRMNALPEDIEAEPWRIHGLWMRGQTVSLMAKYKAGKTTMMLNVVRSLVDGKPFLGQFETEPIAGNLLIVNAEMTRRQFRKWLRDAPIENRHKVLALHIRQAGPSAGDLVSEARRDLFVELLRKHDVRALILDPLNPLLSASGLDENSSTDMARWFNALADVIARTGVEDVMLTHHFGHAGERGRGSSKLMDAPDAIWTYTIGDAPSKRASAEEDGYPDLVSTLDSARPRYLSALGRDVDVARTRVMFDPATRLLSAVDQGREAVEREAARVARLDDLRVSVVKTIAANPGVNKTDIRERVRNLGAKASNEEIGRAVELAVTLGEVVADWAGTVARNDTFTYRVPE